MRFNPRIQIGFKHDDLAPQPPNPKVALREDALNGRPRQGRAAHDFVNV
jgi:hypothetical protein